MSANWLYPPSAIFARSKVVPVMVIEKLDQAVPLAKALVAGGIEILEVTLRTDCALDAISAIREAVPEALVGAGTVLTPEQLDAVIEAGAQFAISPGATKSLLEAGKRAPIALIPGVASVSDAMKAIEQGYDHLKFFPAESSGGAKALKAMAGPLAGLTFCPTGGIGPDNYQDYLKLANVACVGGSWVAPADAITNGEWERITELSRKAIAG
ncbi:bifunctional 4-hydroxy-2-oxoglutarate aldolase/2-dehydro-3-deoxy-phosphogluconate aldolase [Ferrimonas balearica]|uniref:bifunctional 4-hydroxy-2-oxoglutarate aldolase/2-dehydro-3-deoxy-phosphogluconate aldolase n=1 Tax=Ferrimonas balearica TaxID=44012 RepID=UPI001C993762|nr:bifunctional 4-hydroxy-2-oxoglutarate aldolase/2-dehydro-3-deoxy-phosphogluconate aldolase [Ferrimonas balearica]MBY5920345.1 bifunctional 4-hydroxy-2-oxoglutarate aldolase/2-dehydro-3-deoxy-phosphogluconate aldolase [Ferrimonas balearica]MBY5996970.1 bifunctional 4-hydroxy-2-oxoglutarate aldolase/2-dehydro-3-deoxy-phosphogluconate aldolase [Ferrimonas balearica]